MEFKVGHLIFCKGVMLRVIGTGENHIEVIEYSDNIAFGGNELTTKTYSYFQNFWYRWTANGGEPVNLKKIGVIDPSKVPQIVKDFSQIHGFDTLIIKGVPYKQVSGTSLTVPESWTKVFHLKSKNGEAVLNIQQKEKESLYDKGAEGQLLTLEGVTKLLENDVWLIIKH